RYAARHRNRHIRRRLRIEVQGPASGRIPPREGQILEPVRLQPMQQAQIIEGDHPPAAVSALILMAQLCETINGPVPLGKAQTFEPGLEGVTRPMRAEVARYLLRRGPIQEFQD